MSGWHLFSLLAAAVMAVTGLVMLLAPKRFQSDRSKDYDRRLAARLESGQDAYFEELRSIHAYRQPLNPRTIRFFGALLTLFSGVVLVARTFQLVQG